ncbi:DNA primase [Wenjunlia tyrosinilytica]|uniref:DNA primase n=1 Tax=Wenjunlia tyrosinilytica TaxID=1544741 RepID=A0A918DX94_9ACTN|nr:DNA primase [Wenjunlia tyrosinilytica]
MQHVEDNGAPSPQQAEGLLESAVRYAEERHWDVHPGTWLIEDDGPLRCSCGEPHCPRPGAHPVEDDWVNRATGAPAAIRRLWTELPRASVLMPAGRTFDVLDVPEVAGCLALARMERMDIPLGPVCSTPDRRLQFFVLPGASAKVPDLLRRLGWMPGSVDLACRGDGEYVVAPPSRTVTGGALWARRPTSSNRWLPEAEELIGPLAYACAREAAATRNR